MPVYVFALMKAPDARRAVAELPDVATVERDGLAALVMPISEPGVRLTAPLLRSHADTAQGAFQHGPVLVLRFGTALTDEHAVAAELLAPRVEDALKRLEALDGLAEMQVVASYREEPLLRSILAGDRSLAAAATRLRQLPEAATHFERIRVGEAIAAHVEARRAADGPALIGALQGHAVSVAVSEPQGEHTACQAAFLVERAELEAFDHRTEQLADEHAELLQFKLTGPLPAYSFADADPDQLAGLRARREPAWV